MREYANYMMAAQDNNVIHNTRSTTIVVGLGKTGLSCARYLAQQGEPFVVVDSRPEPPCLKQLLSIAPNVECYLGKFDPFIFEQAKRIIVSPGISIKESVIANAKAEGAEVKGDIALFAEHADAPIIAITGSNGKSTVTTLVGEMGKQCHVHVKVGGNLGVPALDLLPKQDAGLLNGVSGQDDQQLPAYYVLELSSFQLETTPDLHAHAAVVLNISADHMDRYSSLQEYVDAKTKIYTNCHNIIYNRDDALVVKMVKAINSEKANSIISFGLSVPQSDQDYGIASYDAQNWLVKGSQRLMPVDDMLLPGRHNQANALAALALGETMGLDIKAMLSVLYDFAGLPHRMQLVATTNDVQWFNDSKGTNVGATVSAISGMPGSKLLIAGGDGKGADFEPLREAVIANNVRLVILIGKDADRIEKALAGVVKIERAANLFAAVNIANKHAKSQEKVILSPACASFDMFNDYQHRGEVFMEAVRNLPL